MKLSSLTTQDKIKLAAELDGATNLRMSFRWEVTDPPEEPVVLIADWPNNRKYPVPDYSTSYDAIIPLIQKQDEEVKRLIGEALSHEINGYTANVIDYLEGVNTLLMATPSQLLDALLVATGKAEL